MDLRLLPPPPPVEPPAIWPAEEPSPLERLDALEAEELRLLAVGPCGRPLPELPPTASQEGSAGPTRLSQSAPERIRTSDLRFRSGIVVAGEVPGKGIERCGLAGRKTHSGRPLGTASDRSRPLGDGRETDASGPSMMVD